MDASSQQVLEANENHKEALDQYISKLQADLNALDKFIGAVEELPDDDLKDDPDDKWCLHADGAFKPMGVIDLTDAVNEKSPFREEALRRERYIKATTPSPFSASEKRYLEKAVVKENKRLAAMRAQQNGESAFEAVALENAFFLENTEDIDWVSVARDVSASNYPVGSRTAQECKVRWLGAQHPKIKNENWSEDEDKRLHDLIESKRDSVLDWEEIAKLLSTNRTSLDCIKRFKSSTRPPFRWSSAMDQKLLDAVQKHGSSNWSLVASSVSPEVSANQCLIRYGRSINPEIKRGKFTLEEDELLMKAIEAHGSDWVKVAQAVPGRTNTQCRGRYTIHLTGGIVKAPWDTEEDAQLRAAVDKHGQKWESVREEMGCVRTRTQYSTRYRILARLGAQGASIGESAASQPHAGTSDGLGGDSTARSTHEAVGDTGGDPVRNGEAVQPVQAMSSPADIGIAKGKGAKKGRKRKSPGCPPESETGDPTAQGDNPSTSTSKGKVTKRGRKRKAPDALPVPEVGEPAAEGSSNTPASKRPKPTPRPIGAMAARLSKTRAAARGEGSGAPSGSAGEGAAGEASQGGANSAEPKEPGSPSGKTMNLQPANETIHETAMDITMDALSDLTDLEDLFPRKKARGKAKANKPVVNRSPTPKRKPKGSSKATPPKPTPTRTIGTRSSRRNIGQASDDIGAGPPNTE